MSNKTTHATEIARLDNATTLGVPQNNPSKFIKGMLNDDGMLLFEEPE